MSIASEFSAENWSESNFVKDNFLIKMRFSILLKEFMETFIVSLDIDDKTITIVIRTCSKCRFACKRKDNQVYLVCIHSLNLISPGRRHRTGKLGTS